MVFCRIFQIDPTLYTASLKFGGYDNSVIDKSKSVRWFSMKCSGEVTNILVDVKEAIKSGNEWMSGIGSKDIFLTNDIWNKLPFKWRKETRSC